MPRGDGTGPMGQGPVGGRGIGQGRGSVGMAASEQCICPKCSITVAHKVGMPCNQIKCPQCGTLMTRNY